MLALQTDPRWSHVRFVRLTSAREVATFISAIEEAVAAPGASRLDQPADQSEHSLRQTNPVHRFHGLLSMLADRPCASTQRPRYETPAVWSVVPNRQMLSAVLANSHSLSSSLRNAMWRRNRSRPAR